MIPSACAASNTSSSRAWTGDLACAGRHVGAQPALEVDRELGIGVHVRQPVAFVARVTRDEVTPVKMMEDNLDPMMFSALRSERRDIYHAARGEGALGFCIHTASNRDRAPAIPRAQNRTGHQGTFGAFARDVLQHTQTATCLSRWATRTFVRFSDREIEAGRWTTQRTAIRMTRQRASVNS